MSSGVSLALPSPPILLRELWYMQIHATSPLCLMCSGIQNSGPHVYQARSLATEPTLRTEASLPRFYDGYTQRCYLGHFPNLP